MGVSAHRTPKTKNTWRHETDEVTVAAGRIPERWPGEPTDPALLLGFEMLDAGGRGTRFAVSVTPDGFEGLLAVMLQVDPRAIEAALEAVSRAPPPRRRG